MAVDNLGEVVETLIGPTLPYGDHGVDEKRYENLLAMTDLVEHLLHEIRDAAKYVDRPEASMKKIASHAKEFLDEVAEIDADSMDDSLDDVGIEYGGKGPGGEYYSKNLNDLHSISLWTEGEESWSVAELRAIAQHKALMDASAI